MCQDLLALANSFGVVLRTYLGTFCELSPGPGLPGGRYKVKSATPGYVIVNDRLGVGPSTVMRIRQTGLHSPRLDLILSYPADAKGWRRIRRLKKAQTGTKTSKKATLDGAVQSTTRYTLSRKKIHLQGLLLICCFPLRGDVGLPVVRSLSAGVVW